MTRARNLVPRRLFVAVLSAVLGVSLFAVAAPAGAATYPNPPHGAKVRAVGASSLTVGAWHSRGARWYRLYVSQVKNDLYWQNIHSYRSTRHVALARQPVITVSGLPSSSAPYYWRFATARHGHIRLGHYIGTVNLRPGAPTGFVAVASSIGGYLGWTSRPATAYQILSSSDSGMVGERRLFTVRAPANQLTPYGLTPGRRYYFKIQTMNGSMASGWSPAVSMVAGAATVPVRFATYNVLMRQADGTVPAGGERIASWDTARRRAVASLLYNSGAEVIAVQEGAGKNLKLPNHWATPRQVDSLATTLGSRFTVAHTEPLWNQTGYNTSGLTGNYLIYRNDLFKPMGSGGSWQSNGHWVAAYQMLRHRSPSAPFLAVSVHLTVGMGYAYDVLRQTEMRDVVNAARAYAHRYGVYSIVYGGDMNSTLQRWHTFDGPTNTALATGLGEANNVAQAHYNSQYASYNKYQRVAPTGLGSIDRIFTERTVSVISWSMLMNVSGGRFVGTIPSDHNAVQSTVMIPQMDNS